MVLLSWFCWCCMCRYRSFAMENECGSIDYSRGFAKLNMDLIKRMQGGWKKNFLKLQQGFFSKKSVSG